MLHRLHLGGAITPSLVLPFRMLGELINVAYQIHGNPTILRAVLGNILVLSIPFPNCNMFFTIMAYSPEASVYHWYILSTMVEFCFTRGFQPAPSSAVLESLYSIPDWESLSTVITPTSSTPTLDFLQQSSYRALGLCTSALMSAGTPGMSNLHLGFTYYADDAVLHGRRRSLVLQMLLLLASMPCDSLQGSIGPALDPLLLLEVMQLLLTSLTAQLAIHDFSKKED